MPDKPLDIAALKALAEKGTPGEWLVVRDERFDNPNRLIIVTEGGMGIAQPPYGAMLDADNAAFIAAANPTTVLALLDYINRLIDCLGSADQRIRNLVDVCRSLNREKNERNQASFDNYARAESAEAKIVRVEAMHRVYYVYDDCGHKHKLGDEGVVDAAGIGLTCVHLYDICWECCTRGDEQSEECASEHGHGTGRPICATVAALKGEHG